MWICVALLINRTNEYPVELQQPLLSEYFTVGFAVSGLGLMAPMFLVQTTNLQSYLTTL